MAARLKILPALLILTVSARAWAAPQGGMLSVPPSPTAGKAGAEGGPASTAPSAITLKAIPETGPVKFEAGDSVMDLLNAMAERFGVIVVQPKPVPAVMPRAAELPGTLDEAMSLARQVLEPQGYAVIRTVSGQPRPHIFLRVGTLKEAQQAELADSPVTSGIDFSVIDVKDPDKLVTHLLPVAHPELLATLERTATTDKDVKAEASGTPQMGYTLILTGPAAKVKKAMMAVMTVDKPTESQSVVRQIKLKTLDARAVADSINASNRPRPGETSVHAVADVRTNTVIVTGPEEKVVDALVGVVSADLAPGGAGVHPQQGQPGEPGAGTMPGK